jgi:membrane-associated phospholipid phosphatase
MIDFTSVPPASRHGPTSSGRELAGSELLRGAPLRESLLRESPLFSSRVVAAVAGLYVLLVVVASFHFNVPLSPDRIVILLLILALTTGKIRLFLRDWSIFLVVLLAWQALNGLSRNIGHFKPHVTEMISADRFLFFGHVPTVWLQHRFFHPGHIAWYDVVSTMLYLMHFAFPLGVAFALWGWRRPVFLQFMMSFLFVALAGFATYVLFPAAPPWKAGQWHYIPHVYKVFDTGIRFFGGESSISGFYLWLWSHGGWDAFGAVPSEHAALPFLSFLYARQAWPRAGWLLLPYCVAVWIAVVYLGEHYVVDIIAGVLYAAAAYAVVQIAVRRQHRRSAPQRQSRDQEAAPTRASGQPS